jgi:hypothetical protein
MPVTKLPRATCPGCGSDVALRVGGFLREHRQPLTMETRGQAPSCAWSGRKPTAARKVELVVVVVCGSCRTGEHMCDQPLGAAGCVCQVIWCQQRRLREHGRG